MKKYLMNVVAIALCAMFGTVVAAVTGSAGEVTWTNTVKKTGPHTYDVHMTALIGSGYRLASQISAHLGPLPTAFTFTPSTSVKLQGATKELGHLMEVNDDPSTKAPVRYYVNKADFVQTVRIMGTTPVHLKGQVQFMVENDHGALAPSSVRFDILVGG